MQLKCKILTFLLKGYVRFATKEACDKVVEMFSSSGSLENVKIVKLTGWQFCMDVIFLYKQATLDLLWMTLTLSEKLFLFGFILCLRPNKCIPVCWQPSSYLQAPGNKIFSIFSIKKFFMYSKIVKFHVKNNFNHQKVHKKNTHKTLLCMLS